MLAKKIGCFCQRVWGHDNSISSGNDSNQPVVILGFKFSQPTMFGDQLPTRFSNDKQHKKICINDHYKEITIPSLYYPLLIAQLVIFYGYYPTVFVVEPYDFVRSISPTYKRSTNGIIPRSQKPDCYPLGISMIQIDLFETNISDSFLGKKIHDALFRGRNGFLYFHVDLPVIQPRFRLLNIAFTPPQLKARP